MQWLLMFGFCVSKDNLLCIMLQLFQTKLSVSLFSNNNNLAPLAAVTDVSENACWCYIMKLQLATESGSSDQEYVYMAFYMI